MAIFREKSRDFWNRYTDAVRFDGSVDSIVDLLSDEPPTVALECEKGRHVWTGNLVVLTPDGEEIVKPGDWIVTLPTAKRRVFDDEKFRLTFEEVA